MRQYLPAPICQTATARGPAGCCRRSEPIEDLPMKKPLLFAFLVAAASATAQVAPYKVVGDGIPQSLTGKPGDAARGRALLAKRETANCLQCHAVKKDKELAAGGDKGPALDGVGSALTPAQLRLSVVDYSRITRGTAMPSFHKAGGADADKPALSAAEIEDIVAYLSTLKSK
jgi:sulfur-oxidizing protein SoxX